MAVNIGARYGVSGRFSALALGAALMALPGAAMAQHDDHRGDRGGNNAPHEQQAPRPAPAPAPAERGGDRRGSEPWNGQARPPQGNPGGNGWQARPPQPNFGQGQGRPAYQGQPANQGRPAYQGQAYNQGRPAYQGQGAYQNQQRGDGGGRNDGGQWRNGGGGDHRDGGQWRNEGNGGRNYGGQWRQDGGEHRDGGQWNHSWRQDNRYDWRGWREENRDAFHVGRYYPPYRDYSYDRLGVGFYLQPLFFGSDYWIDDPYYYHLPPAYGPYHWVRYYNDAILVDTYTGQVADVIYDFFW